MNIELFGFNSVSNPEDEKMKLLGFKLLTNSSFKDLEKHEIALNAINAVYKVSDKSYTHTGTQLKNTKAIYVPDSFDAQSFWKLMK
jgi:hypothetical protein